MTLGRLIELYQAEQQGKQIMMNSYYFGYYSSHKHTKKIKIAECELKDILNMQENTSITFYIKNEEDEDGYKLQ